MDFCSPRRTGKLSHSMIKLSKCSSLAFSIYCSEIIFDSVSTGEAFLPLLGCILLIVKNISSKVYDWGPCFSSICTFDYHVWTHLWMNFSSCISSSFIGIFYVPSCRTYKNYLMSIRFFWWKYSSRRFSISTWCYSTVDYCYCWELSKSSWVANASMSLSISA